MVRSPADGYTLMIGNVSTNAITPIIYPEKFKIDYAKDVVPITDTVDIPAFLLATTKDFKVDTVAGLIDYTKKNPGRVRYGTVGPGSYPHYDMAYFAKRAGDLDMIAVPSVYAIGERDWGTMLKSVIVIAALAAIAAPSLALAQGNSNNTPASQNANGLPFTANDPPLSSFPGQGQGPPSLPQPFGRQLSSWLQHSCDG